MDNYIDKISCIKKLDEYIGGLLFSSREAEILFFAKFLCNGCEVCAKKYELIDCSFNSESFKYVAMDLNGNHFANSNSLLEVLEFCSKHNYLRFIDA
jgi:hypothetical protein